jgi:hypothetical protein
MKEAVFILLVIGVLLALTAVRYRKQIAGLISLAKVLRETKRAVLERTPAISREAEKSIPLVNCAGCGVWVPRTKALRRSEVYFCSDKCMTSAVN